MTQPTISIAEIDVFNAVRAFLLAILPTNTEVLKSQQNSLPMPTGGFVAMNATRMVRLSTNLDTYSDVPDDGQKLIEADTQYTMQLDFYGPTSQEWAMTAQTLFRDQFATDSFPANIQPLYADDPVQIPLINAESQYEQRWKLEALLQVNPVVTIDQDFTDTIDVGIISVDVTYPP